MTSSNTQTLTRPDDVVTVRHLRVSGTQRDIGRALAAAAEKAHGAAARPLGIDPDIERIRRRWFEQHHPTQAERIRGVADHFGIDPSDPSVALDWLGTYELPAGCSVACYPGSSTKDGHSLVLASTVPACQAYDPAFAYEVAAIIKHGLDRMYGGAAGPNGDNDPDVFYYLTLYNENYVMPARPSHVTDLDIVQGLYKWADAPQGTGKRVTLLFSGSAQGAARAAAAELAEHWDVGAELWSATSYKLLREDALAAERWNRLNPPQVARTPLVTELMTDTTGPIVAVSDFMKIVPEQIARFVPGRTFVPLGTDGMGRSDTREALRAFFETDMPNIVLAVVAALVKDGKMPSSAIGDVIAKYGLDPLRVDPYHV